MRSCEGCEHVSVEPAGKGYVFVICGLGKFDRERAAVDVVPEEFGRTSVPVPAWCKSKE